MLRLFSLALVVAANNATSECEQNGYSSQDCSTTTTPVASTTVLATADDTTTLEASSDDTTTIEATSETTLAPSDGGTTTLPVIVPSDLGTTLEATATVNKIMRMDVTFAQADAEGDKLKQLQNLCALLVNCAARNDCKDEWGKNLENCPIENGERKCKYLTYGDRASAAGVTCQGLQRRRGLQTSYGYDTTYDISAPVTANRDATTVESDLQAAKVRIENGAKDIEKANLRQAANHPEANKGADGQPLLSATDVTDLEAALDRATVAVTATDAPTAGVVSYASALAGVSTVFAAVFV